NESPHMKPASPEEATLIDAEAACVPTVPPTPVQSRAQHLLLAASLILIAFNLRPVLASVPVLLPEIATSTGLTSLGASYLTSILNLCLGLFAPRAIWLALRIVTYKTLLGALLVLTVGTALRG